jgi:hypothetical protein
LVLRQLEDASISDKERVSVAELLRDHSQKSKKDEPAAAPEPVEPPPVRTADKEPAKVVPEPVPQVTYYKKTVTVRNGPVVEVRTFWVDENDEVVVPGQPQEQQVPAPAVERRKKEEKVID